MHSAHLHKFISILESCNELVRITVATDPLQEIAAITERVCKLPFGGKALLFEHPDQSRFPVATNLFGSLRRVCLALGIEELDALTVRMSALLDGIASPSLSLLDSQIAALPAFSRFTPLLSCGGYPNLLPMTPPDLTLFPFLQNWTEDGSATGNPRYITLPQVFTANPDGGSPNCGMYRAQLLGPHELAIQWKAGSGAARHAEEFRRQGRPMPVAITLGGDPAILFSSICPLPGDLDEMTFAGFLRGAPLAVTSCRTVPLRVPEGVEVLIEGVVEPGASVMEGPFGNHTGFYGPAAPAALMRVTSISHRYDAVIPATVVGPPPMEDCWMAKAWEHLLLALLRSLAPVVAGLHFPLEWIFHQSAIISLENPSPGMVRETAGFLWSTPWFKASRLLIFIDADGNSDDTSQVAWRSINLSEFDHDLFHDASGKRFALDATGRGFPRSRTSRGDVSAAVAQRWKEYAID